MSLQWWVRPGSTLTVQQSRDRQARQVSATPPLPSRQLLPPALMYPFVRGTFQQIWTNKGRHVSNPRFQNLRAEYLSGRAISLSEDAVAILDRTSPKCVRVCDVSTGRPLADGKTSEVVHECEVVREVDGGGCSCMAMAACPYKWFVVREAGTEIERTDGGPRFLVLARVVGVAFGGRGSTGARGAIKIVFQGVWPRSYPDNV